MRIQKIQKQIVQIQSVSTYIKSNRETFFGTTGRVLHIRNHFIRNSDAQFLRKQWIKQYAIVLKQ